jgi:ferrous iron transport protein A
MKQSGAMEITMTLDQLEPGRVALVSAITGDPRLQTSLREIGFAELDEVEVLGRGPIGRSPISVRLNRMTVALRPAEAACIAVDPVALEPAA